MACRQFALLQHIQLLRRIAGQITVASLNHRQNHADQTHALTIFRAENTGHAIRMQIRDFFRYDHTAAAAEYFDMRAAALFQQVDHVFKVFDMATLIAGNRNPLRIFLQRCSHDIVDGTVMAKVNHFRAVRHQDTAHDVDRGVVAVKQGSCGHKAYFVSRFVFGEFLDFGQVSHVFLSKMNRMRQLVNGSILMINVQLS